MKCKALFILLFLPICSSAQNLVPNGSFEEYEECPNTLDQVFICSPWYSVLNSCDYYNSCSELVGVPDNGTSYQYAFDGEGYCGFLTYMLNTPNAREVMGIILTEPLQVKSTYYFSFWLNRADKTDNIKATNNIGLRFSNDEFLSEEELISNFSHWKVDSIVYNQETWSYVSGSFLADDTYSYLFFGNFYDDAHTETDGPGTVWDRNGYYNIDDIRLSLDSIYAWPVVHVVENSFAYVLSYHFDMESSALSLQSKSDVELRAYSLNGALILSQNLSKGAHTIDWSVYNKGLYVISAVDENGNQEQFKILKL